MASTDIKDAIGKACLIAHVSPDVAVAVVTTFLASFPGKTTVEELLLGTPQPQATWMDKLLAERVRLGRELTLNEMLALARGHDMTPDEIAAQRASWQRQTKD